MIAQLTVVVGEVAEPQSVISLDAETSSSSQWHIVIEPSSKDARRTRTGQETRASTCPPGATDCARKR